MTRSKTATSQVNELISGIMALNCTGWIESSANHGKTWQRATPICSLFGAVFAECAFPSAVADGKGRLARACLKSTGATVCTAAW